MIVIAQVSAWFGAALLLLAISAAVVAPLLLPFKKLMARDALQATVDGGTRPSANFNGAGLVLSWLAWPIYAIFTVTAFLGEMGTLFSNAGFGYLYIMLGMPAFLVAWLALVTHASIRPAPRSWLFGALGAAGLIFFGYAKIN